MNIQLDSLLKNSPFPWWEWDIIRNTVIFNDRKATMLGYDAERFKGKGYQKFTDLLHRGDYERTMEDMRQVLQGKKELYQIDYRILASDGHYRWYMDRGTVIETTEGRPSKMRGIVIDLGEENPQEGAGHILLDFIKSASLNDETGLEDSYFTLCSNCLKVKKDNQRWIPVSKALLSGLEGKPSHGICPDCIRLLYPGYADFILQDVV